MAGRSHNTHYFAQAASFLGLSQTAHAAHMFGGMSGFGGMFGQVGGLGLFGGVSGGGVSQFGEIKAAATELKEAAKSLKEAADNLKGIGTTQLAQQPTKIPEIPAEGLSGAGAAAGAAGAALLVIVAAAEITKKAFSATAESAYQLNAKTLQVSEGFAKIVGVPESIANLGAATANVLSPLRIVGDGFKALAGMISINPMDWIKAPMELFKANLDAMADAGKALIRVFLDMRNPAELLGSAMSSFTTSVAKFNPATVERFQLVLDNLSAAAGHIFEPVVEAAIRFGDELNVIYTTVAPAFRATIQELIPPMTNLGRFVALGLMRSLAELLPVLQPLASVFVSVAQAVATVGEFLISRFAPSMTELVGAFQPVTDAFLEIMPELAVFGVSIIDLTVTVTQHLMPVFQTLTYAVGVAAVDVALFANAARSSASLLNPANWNQVGLASALFGVVSSVNTTARQIVDFNRFRNNPQRRLQRQPLRGPVTMAAQEARQINIEQIGLEARARAFSQGAGIQEAIRDNTRDARDALRALLDLARNNAGGSSAMSGPLPGAMGP